MDLGLKPSPWLKNPNKTKPKPIREAHVQGLGVFFKIFEILQIEDEGTFSQNHNMARGYE